MGAFLGCRLCRSFDGFSLSWLDVEAESHFTHTEMIRWVFDLFMRDSLYVSGCPWKRAGMVGSAYISLAYCINKHGTRNGRGKKGPDEHNMKDEMNKIQVNLTYKEKRERAREVGRKPMSRTWLR